MFCKIKELYKKYEEVVLYLFFGVLTTIVSVGLYFLFDVLFNWLSVYFNNPSITLQNNGAINSACVIVKNIIAIIFAYVTNRKYVFKSKVYGFKNIMIEMLNFFGARALTLVFEVVFMFITANVLGFNTMIMNIIAQFVIVVLNYVFSKLWIFKEKDKNAKTL